MSNNYFNWNVKKSEETVEMEVFPTVAEGEERIDNEIVPGLTSIIIPAYLNSYPIFHTTGNCIGSIREHTDKEMTPYEIILVLNGKPIQDFTDYSQTYCDKVIPLDENEGYARGVNRGIRAARGENIAIVNNDVQVFDHWLEDMHMALKSFDLDLVMATPMYGKAWARAVEARELRDAYFQGGMEVLSDFRDFSCVLVRRSVFDEVGLFDEQFFMYGEDLDLLRRMDKAGKKYASTRLVNVHHIIGMTSSSMQETPDIMNKSKEILKNKWGE